MDAIREEVAGVVVVAVIIGLAAVIDMVEGLAAMAIGIVIVAVVIEEVVGVAVKTGMALEEGMIGMARMDLEVERVALMVSIFSKW